MNWRQLSTVAPAKVNLYLELLARRDDGFHRLETVMSAVDLCDHISVMKTDSNCIKLTVQDWNRSPRATSIADQIPQDDSNLATLALRRLFQVAGLDLSNGNGAQIKILKKIPTAAGLGGGSSDAAAVIRLGNRLWNLGLDDQRLNEVAANLGSDVPFFLGMQTALCTGRGEIVLPLQRRLSPAVVIVKPSFGFSTAEVYSRAIVPDQPRSVSPIIETLAGGTIAKRGTLARLGGMMFNRLEEAANRVNRWVEEIKNQFGRMNCLGHQLSGSGSSYFGIFQNRLVARRAAKVLQAMNPSVEVYCCRLTGTGAT